MSATISLFPIFMGNEVFPSASIVLPSENVTIDASGVVVTVDQEGIVVTVGPDAIKVGVS